MKKIISAIIVGIFCCVLLQPAEANLVQESVWNKINGNTDDIAKTAEYSADSNLEQIIGTIIRLVLSVLGVIFLSLMFVAGNNWMQAAGNEEKVKKSKETIRSLLVGLCIVLIAYALSYWLVSFVSSALITK